MQALIAHPAMAAEWPAPVHIERAIGRILAVITVISEGTVLDNTRHIMPPLRNYGSKVNRKRSRD
jgi:hypothetical protein